MAWQQNEVGGWDYREGPVPQDDVGGVEAGWRSDDPNPMVDPTKNIPKGYKAAGFYDISPATYGQHMLVQGPDGLVHMYNAGTGVVGGVYGDGSMATAQQRTQLAQGAYDTAYEQHKIASDRSVFDPRGMPGLALFAPMAAGLALGSGAEAAGLGSLGGAGGSGLSAAEMAALEAQAAGDIATGVVGSGGITGTAASGVVGSGIADLAGGIGGVGGSGLSASEMAALEAQAAGDIATGVVGSGGITGTAASGAVGSGITSTLPYGASTAEEAAQLEAMGGTSGGLTAAEGATLGFPEAVTTAGSGITGTLSSAGSKLADWVVANPALAAGLGLTVAGIVTADSRGNDGTAPSGSGGASGTVRPFTYTPTQNPNWKPIQQGQTYIGGQPFQTQKFTPGEATPLSSGGVTGAGIAALGYSDGGGLKYGPGTGLSDEIPARINGTQEARLADGEFVVPADVVSALGGGSTKSGAQQLYAMLDRVRRQAHGSTKQIRKVSNKALPK